MRLVIGFEIKKSRIEKSIGMDYNEQHYTQENKPVSPQVQTVLPP